MKLSISSKGFDLHDAQKFTINKGITKLNRYLQHTPQDLINTNVVISCHHNPTVFTSHVYLELPDRKISAMASARKFPQAFNQSLSKLMQQLRKRKTQLINLRANPKVIQKSA